MTVNVVLGNRLEIIPGFTFIVLLVLSCCWWRPVWFSKKVFLNFSSFWVVPYQGGCSQNLISFRYLNVSICDWEYNFVHQFLGVITSFALGLLVWISDASIISNSSMSATIMSPFQTPSAYNTYPRNILGNTFFPNWWSLDGSFAEMWWYSTNEPNGVIGPSKWFAEAPFVRCSPIRQEILNASQIAVTLHGIRPPFFVQARLQQNSRGSLLYPSYRPLSNSICFWTVRCRRTMIPG